MKKTMLNVSLLLAAGAVGSALAADGTINFTGSVADSTCTVATASQSLNVALGNVSQTALNSAIGTKAAPTRFTISLTGCPATVTGANIKFDGTSNATNKNLLAVTGTATGLGIEIADSSGTPIPLHTNSSDYTLSTGANLLDFIARYVSTSTTVGKGTANGTSQFTINYK